MQTWEAGDTVRDDVEPLPPTGGVILRIENNRVQFHFYSREVITVKKKLNVTILVASILILCSGALVLSVADDDGHEQREHEYKRDAEQKESSLKQVDNPTYQEECGACHFAYQPELLPSASWTKILANLEDHFGEAVELDPDSKAIIASYLQSNAADKSSAKRAVKIMRSVGQQVPPRITEIQYIKEKHHEISADVLKRKAIESLSNCSACHVNAERGIYDEDDVKIPK